MNPQAPGVRNALKALASGRIAASTLMQDALAAADASKLALHAFSAVDRPGASKAAMESEKRYAQNRQRPLEGLAIGVKDMIDTKGIETRYGSAAYAGHMPHADADVVTVLTQLGAIVVGKTSTHEFAWGVTTGGTTEGDVLNPLDLTRIPGGSSGGAAAAIACGAVAAGLGTDTGGSVRIPAALCGVVGFKPTFGRLSTRGIFPLSPTLDHPGLLGGTVDDVAVLASAFGLDALQEAVRSPARVGVIGNFAPVPLSTEVAAAFDAAASILTRRFACEAVDGRRLFSGVYEAFAHIVLTEGAVEHLRRNDAGRIAAHYSGETIDRLERAKALTLGDYARAQHKRRAFAATLQHAMSALDFLVLPTCPCIAPRLNEETIEIGNWWGSVREALMTYTAPFNVAGFPAISIPLAAGNGELPKALQIVAKPGFDGSLLQIAKQIERLLEPQATD